MLRLSPCPDCDRHVRVDASACPFCGSDAARPAPKRPQRRRGRTTRAALFFAGVLGASACGGDQNAGSDGPSGQEAEEEDPESMNDIYGGPPMDEDDPPADDDGEAEDEAAPSGAYGAPPSDVSL